MIDKQIDDLVKEFPPQYRPPAPIHVQDWILDGKPFGVPFYLVRETPLREMGFENLTEKVEFNAVMVIRTAARAAVDLMENDGAYLYPYEPMNVGSGTTYKIADGIYLAMEHHGWNSKIVVAVYMMKYIQRKTEEVNRE